MQLGFIGTGTMGTPIAGCLIDAGHRLTVYDIRSEATAALAARGAAVAANPRAVAERSEVVFTSLPGPDEMEPTVLDPATGILAGLRAGCGYIDLTTNAPTVARRVGEACRVSGVDMLDAPVSGRPPGMTVMVGGDEGAVFVRYRPLFEVIARNIFYVGAAGAGCIAKLVTQYLGYTSSFIAALGRGAADRLRQGRGRSAGCAGADRAVQRRGQPHLRQHSALGAVRRLHRRRHARHRRQGPAHLAWELAPQVAAPGSPGLLAHDVFHRAQAQGWGQDGFPVAARILEAMAGRELRSQTGRNAVSYQAQDPRRGGR